MERKASILFLRISALFVVSIRENSRDAIFAITFFLLSAASNAAVINYSGLVLFGDSLSDTGNQYFASASPPSPYWQGRNSNGPLYAEVLANGLGVSLVNSLSGGTNYAFGGATAQAQLNTSHNLIEQEDQYLSSVGGVVDPKSLFVVWGGGNDLLRAPSTAQTAANVIVNIVDKLISAGAKTILVPNFPGYSPDFNNSLAQGLSGLTGATIIQLDVYNLLNKIKAHPAAYGFTNVDSPCYKGGVGLGGGTVCANPDQYLLWDSIHPSAATHRLIGQLALEQVNQVSNVPVPASSWLFLSALLGLFLRARN